MNKKIIIDINCDLGEGSTREDADNDALLMSYLSSCNIACGGHAGNAKTIEYAINDALENQLKIGAHPGYPDLENFGRKTHTYTQNQVIEFLHEQMGRFLAIADRHKARLNHIKLHGALYNDVEHNLELASVVASTFAESFPNIEIYGLAQGTFQKVCEEKQLNFIPEGFIDRRYTPENKLAARTIAGAMITEDEECIEQAIALAKNQSIKSITGELITPIVKTICLHGDNENALSIAKKLKQALSENNISIA
ncbi:MAG: 5-oxoprolinase subunit PxpA [Gammaproteobacteria bacterium]|jgi:UPF0271 protein